jgi:hypothetical protein
MDVESYVDFGIMQTAATIKNDIPVEVDHILAQIKKDGGKLIFENLPGMKKDGA